MTRFLTDWQQRSTVLAEASKARYKPSIWRLVLIFIGLFILGQVVSLLIVIPFVLSAIPSHELSITSIDAFINSKLWVSLLATIPTTVVFLYYMKYVERRSFASMGFVRGKIAAHYVQGLGWGVLMCLVALGIACTLSGMRFEGFTAVLPWGMLLLYFVGFLFQGMSEEVICRSFLMVSAANKAPLWIGIALNSLVFAVMHLANDGVTVLSFLNLVLYGVFASFFFLRTDNVWGIGALHATWNFTQGNLLGVQVSGNVLQDTAMHFGSTEAPAIISGGKFGLEGSIATSIVYLAAIFLLIFLPRRQNRALKIE